MNYNLKRIALNTLIDNETLHSDIKSSLDGSIDYWTEIEAPDDQFYSVNVYSVGNGFLTIVYISEQGCDQALMEFYVDLESLLPAESDSEFKVEILVTTVYKTTVKASDAITAKDNVQKKIDNIEWSGFKYERLETKVGIVEGNL